MCDRANNTNKTIKTIHTSNSSVLTFQHSIDQNTLAWWKVDMETEHCITKVSILNRSDCCGKFLISRKHNTIFQHVIFFVNNMSFIFTLECNVFVFILISFENSRSNCQSWIVIGSFSKHAMRGIDFLNSSRKLDKCDVFTANFREIYHHREGKRDFDIM